MNQRDAKRRAASIAADLIRAALARDWAFADTEADEERVENALTDLIGQLDRRASGPTP